MDRKDNRMEIRNIISECVDGHRSMWDGSQSENVFFLEREGQSVSALLILKKTKTK